MKKVKFSFSPANSSIFQQTPKSAGIWGDYKFYFNEESDDYDYWVTVFELGKPEKFNCNQKNTLFITGEPPSYYHYDEDYINQFDKILTCDLDIKHKNKILSQQSLPWFVWKSYDELKSIKSVPKQKKISIVTSNKQLTEGHRKRYEFAMRLKEELGDKIDLFGRGIRDFDNKWDVLAPYKYHIALENSSFYDYFTEKISDCYLAHTFPIYYGCKNINNYFDQGSFASIDINDFDKSLAIITALLEDDQHYEKSLDLLLKQKQKCLDEYNLFPNIVRIIESEKQNLDLPKQLIEIQTESYFREKPKVSVLMPVWNCEEYLAESIESILGQSFKDFEFIIVNDSSSDNSEAIIEKYQKIDNRIHLYNNQLEKGIVGALNTGLKFARGQYIVRMDGDDISLPERLALQVKFMDENPNVGVCGTWAEFFGKVDKVQIKHPVYSQQIEAAMLFNLYLIHPTTIIRKSVLRENNLSYREEFKYSEDFDLWERLTHITKFANFAKVLLKYRTHDKNVFVTFKEKQKSGTQAIQKRILEKLKIDFSTEELNFHYKISNWEFSSEISFVNEMFSWLNKILAANRKQDYFDQDSLFYILRDKLENVFQAGNLKKISIFIKYYISLDKYEIKSVLRFRSILRLIRILITNIYERKIKKNS